MRDGGTAWLVEIEDAIANIRVFTEGMDETTFVADARTCAATAMYLIVIGESARRLPSAVHSEAPETRGP